MKSQHLFVFLLLPILASAQPPGITFTLQRAYELIDQGNPLLIEGYLKAWSEASPREIDMSDQFGHEWLWEGDAPLQESKTVFLMTMHDHLEQWIGLETPPIAHIRRVAERLSASFPGDGASRAAVGLSHLLDGNASLSVPHLKRATELEPRNGSLWLMLAEGYEAAGDIAAAIGACERVLELGNEEQKSVAASKLERLR